MVATVRLMHVILLGTVHVIQDIHFAQGLGMMRDLQTVLIGGNQSLCVGMDIRI